MSKLINFQSFTKKKEPIKEMCEAASNTFQDIIILGQTKDGQFQLMSTYLDERDIVYNMECARFCFFKDGTE